MFISDTLSCNPTYTQHDESENEDVMMLPDHLFIQTVDLSLQQSIREAQDLDLIVREAVTALQSSLQTMHQDLANWRVDQGMIFYKDKCYVRIEIRGCGGRRVVGSCASGWGGRGEGGRVT